MVFAYQNLQIIDFLRKNVSNSRLTNEKNKDIRKLFYKKCVGISLLIYHNFRNAAPIFVKKQAAERLKLALSVSYNSFK